MLIVQLLLAMHTLNSVTFSLPPGVLGWLRLLLVALSGLFCLTFFSISLQVLENDYCLSSRLGVVISHLSFCQRLSKHIFQ